MLFWKTQSKTVVAVLIAAFVAACGREEVASPKSSGSPAIETTNQPSTAAAQGSREQDAQFRLEARRVYVSLFQPSCEAPPGSSRDSMLGDERRAVSEFEQYLNGRPGSDHLNIAKADAALESGCWMDSDPVFALMHVNTTKEEVRLGLEQMRELAPMLRPLALASGSASTGGEFRLGVRRLIGAIEPQCQIVAGFPNDQVLAPARERVDQFERELSGSALAAQFDVAKADAEFELSITYPTCLVPESRELELVRQMVLQDVEAMTSALQAIIGR